MSSSARFYLPRPASSLSGATSRTVRARRYVDAVTRDYVVEQGGLKQDDGFTSQVVLALATDLGSCQVLPTFGSRLREIKRADEQGRRLAEKHARTALAHLTDQVRDLMVTATIQPPSAIVIVVSGRRGMTAVQATYTAVMKS